MYVMETRSFFFFFVHGFGVCMFVWVCGCMAVFLVWAWRRLSVGSGLGCRRGVRCAGVVLGGGAAGAGLGSAGSRCWGRAGGAAFDRVHWPSSAPGFRGVGARPLLCCRLGACVVRSWRWPGLGSVGSRCWGRSGSAVCIFVCMRLKEC